MRGPAYIGSLRVFKDNRLEPMQMVQVSESEIYAHPTAYFRLQYPNDPMRQLRESNAYWRRELDRRWHELDDLLRGRYTPPWKALR